MLEPMAELDQVIGFLDVKKIDVLEGIAALFNFSIQIFSGKIFQKIDISINEI